MENKLVTPTTPGNSIDDVGSNGKLIRRRVSKACVNCSQSHATCDPGTNL
jgi:hypothetical protein